MCDEDMRVFNLEHYRSGYYRDRLYSKIEQQMDANHNIAKNALANIP
jgi:hypothetical protein